MLSRDAKKWEAILCNAGSAIHQITPAPCAQIIEIDGGRTTHEVGVVPFELHGGIGALPVGGDFEALGRGFARIRVGNGFPRSLSKLPESSKGIGQHGPRSLIGLLESTQYQ